MATTGWGPIYFNLLNIFKIHNLHTSLPLSSRSARHPHSARPFVICCTAQSTFLPISRFPALSRSRRTFPGFSSKFVSILATPKQRKQFVSIFQGQAGRISVDLQQEGAGRSRKEQKEKETATSIDIADHQGTIVLVGCTDAPMPLAASQTVQEKQSCLNLFLPRR